MGLAIWLVVAAQPGHAEQSFPAEPEQPLAFEPVPVRRWRASAAAGYEYDAGGRWNATQQFLPFAARLEYGALALGVTTSWTSVEGEQVVSDKQQLLRHYDRRRFAMIGRARLRDHLLSWWQRAPETEREWDRRNPLAHVLLVLGFGGLILLIGLMTLVLLGRLGAALPG